MPDARAFRELVSGRRRGVGAALAREFLRLAEVPYVAAVEWRNRRYDSGRAQIHSAAVPVVSVGNITMGGTGKTPMVVWLARWFAERGLRVGLVSRGYGAEAGKKNDEAMELEQALPGVPHVQNPDRVAGARAAIEQFGCELLILDDGFQHRRLGRDLDIVLLDATQPFGFEHVFPRGMLREPIRGLERADAVCLTRADSLDSAERSGIRERVAAIVPRAAWGEAVHAPSELRNASGQTNPIEMLAGKRVLGFCGIGNPAAFRRTLTEAGADTVEWRVFPDHHVYDAGDQAALDAAVVSSGAELAVCTRKDLVKLPVARLGSQPLWAMAIEMRITAGRDALENALTGILKQCELSARKG
jgi:tetraacyldisaccharide 4'-kinase